MTLLFTPLVSAKEKMHKNLVRYLPKTKIFSYNPLYPVSYKNENSFDTLKVKSQIDENGFVVDVQILQSIGINILDSIAIKTAYKYRYMPDYSDGKPTTCWIKEDIVFDTLSFLNEGEVPPEIIEF